jgi:very-short-patch-repair endonuclease
VDAFLLLAAVVAAMAWRFRLSVTRRPRRQFPQRRAFQPKDTSRPPSDFLRAIAQKRRRDRLARPTSAEIRFDEILRSLGFIEGRDYERERIFFYPGSFCLFDFYFPRDSLIVELDGGVHNEASQRNHDLGRDTYFVAQGLRTCRISNRIVLKRPRACKAIIRAQVQLPTAAGRGRQSAVSRSRGRPMIVREAYRKALRVLRIRAY